jgi:hypothetical protein
LFLKDGSTSTRKEYEQVVSASRSAEVRASDLTASVASRDVAVISTMPGQEGLVLTRDTEGAMRRLIGSGALGEFGEWWNRWDVPTVRRQVHLPGGRRHVFITYPLVEVVTFHNRVDKDTGAPWVIAADVFRREPSDNFDVTFHLRSATLPWCESGVEAIRSGHGGWRTDREWCEMATADIRRAVTHDDRRLRASEQNVHVLECSFCRDISEPDARGWTMRCPDDGSTVTMCPTCLSRVARILEADRQGKRRSRTQFR